MKTSFSNISAYCFVISATLSNILLCVWVFKFLYDGMTSGTYIFNIPFSKFALYSLSIVFNFSYSNSTFLLYSFISFNILYLVFSKFLKKFSICKFVRLLFSISKSIFCLRVTKFFCKLLFIYFYMKQKYKKIQEI